MSEDVDKKIKCIDDAIKKIEESEHSCFLLDFKNFKIIKSGSSEEALLSLPAGPGSYFSVNKDNYKRVLETQKYICQNPIKKD